MDRKHKESIIRDRLEKALKKSENQWRSNFGVEMPKERKEWERKEFEKAANRVDRGKLHDILNDKV